MATTTNYPSQVLPFKPFIEKYTTAYKVPVDVVIGTIMTESAGNPKAWNGQNNENSRGLMQISEKTALSTLKVPQADLQRLFEPEYNIERGTWYLSYLYNLLKPYFGTLRDEKQRWMVVSSSYNQGAGYYIKAMQSLTAEGKQMTFDMIRARVLAPVGGGATPWVANVNEYYAKVFKWVSSVDTTTKVGIGAVVFVGIGLYVVYNMMKASGRVPA